MPRRGNYGSEKRQKEITRKKKAESKMERRRAKRERAAGGGQADDQAPAETPEGSAGEDATIVP